MRIGTARMCQCLILYMLGNHIPWHEYGCYEIFVYGLDTLELEQNAWPTIRRR